MFYPIALIVVGAVVLWAGRRLGDAVPFLVFIAVAAAGDWFAQDLPHSPVACLSGHGAPCGPHQAPALIAISIVIPGVAVIAYKTLRGDYKR